MKNIKSKLLAGILVCISVISIVMVSCEKEADEVLLYSFGPSPVLRGSEIRFIGQNLDRINTITVPEEIGITDITVTSSSEISIIVPQEAEPGYIVLNYDGGSITTKTMLGFTEPYSITSVSPSDKPVREGDTITISGEYLNNIIKVIFQLNAVVDTGSFITHTRSELKVKVPREASSGKIIVEDGIGNQLYSEDELNISQPSISGFSSTTVKAGENLTVNGKNLDLTEKLVFPGGSEVMAENFESVSEGSILVATPDNLQDGKIKLLAFSGIEVESTQGLTTVVPSDIQIEAESRYKAGLNVFITGLDLDLVSSVTFGGSAEITGFTLTGETKITVAIPNSAVDGAVVLNMMSGKTVSTNAITVVAPAITSIDPLTVIAGNEITITGTDLDLVKSVSFKDGLSVNVTPSSETSFTVSVPPAAESGKITLVALNGVQVVSADELTVEAANIPVITSISEQVKPGGLLVIEGSKLNLVESVYFQEDVKATSFGSRTEGMIEVYVPETAKSGTVTLTLITFDLTEVTSPEFRISGVDPILPTTKMVIDYEQHGDHNGYWDAGWDGHTEILVEEGNTFLHIFENLSGWVLNCNHQANGAPAPIIENVENYVIKLDVRIEEGVTGAENAELQLVFADQWNYWYGGGLLPASTGGDWITISIPVSTWSMTGTLDLSSGTYGMYGGTIPGGVSFDNFRFDLQ